MRLRDMQEFAIFDFDGTITNLRVDWDLLKKNLSITRISEIWNLQDHERQIAFDQVSDFEVKGITLELLIDRNIFHYFKQIAVLTNNSEETVNRFFDNLTKDRIINPPVLVVGRETLQGPKEDQEIFGSAIKLIFNAMNISSPENCVYVGDQEYELHYAKKIGLNAIGISKFHKYYEG